MTLQHQDPNTTHHHDSQELFSRSKEITRQCQLSKSYTPIFEYLGEQSETILENGVRQLMLDNYIWVSYTSILHNILQLNQLN